MLLRDRTEAGHRLAERLRHLADADAVVVGLPRGGVPVAAVVARSLDAPLDVIIVRKLGVPSHPELAMGAIGEDGVEVLDDQVLQLTPLTGEDVAAVELRERAELDRRVRRFRAEYPKVPLKGRVVIIVDDGVATGSTAKAACIVARAQGASRVVLATPVAPVDWTQRLAGAADEFVSVATPEPFGAVGRFYDDFSPTTDDDVEQLLRESWSTRHAVGHGAVDDIHISIPGSEVRLDGFLAVPAGARGLVIFVHGSGSSRLSPRNRHVASSLNRAGFATLLFDLLTADEARDRGNVFDIALLSRRLGHVTDWVRAQPRLADLPIGYFGASTGAAAALAAAAHSDIPISAIVSRGGRPDLAEEFIGDVTAPTLLIVGSLDETVLGVNRRIRSAFRAPNKLAVVPGATHLFEEPGTLDAAAHAAADWFAEHLV